MSDNTYCYPGTDVMRNLLGIKNSEVLQEAERRLTSLRIDDLIVAPMEGQFDFQHLQDIHRYIFQDVYEWAGMIRTVNIAKSSMFCAREYIDEQAKLIFNSLRRELAKGTWNREQAVKRLAYYFSEINALHPFREGNGRAQREFIRELALSQGFRIIFAEVSEDEMMQASVDSFLCNYERMENLFDKVVE